MLPRIAMTTHFRIAQVADISELVQLMGQLGYQTSVGEIEQVIEQIRQTQGEVFVAEFANKIVGCINAVVDIRLAEGKVGEVASLVVSEDFRGRGLGRALLRYAEEWLRPRVSSVRIRANAKRADAHRFYSSLGYEELKQQKVFIKKM